MNARLAFPGRSFDTVPFLLCDHRGGWRLYAPCQRQPTGLLDAIKKLFQVLKGHAILLGIGQ